MSRRAEVIIIAIDERGGFAKDKKLPWHHSKDLQRFKEVTMDNAVVMGRNTYEEIRSMAKDPDNSDSVLPGRVCFVVSNTLETLPDAHVIKRYDDVYTHPAASEVEHIVTIGGEQLYNSNLHLADVVYTTVMLGDYDCDQFLNVDVLSKLFYPVTTEKLDEDARFVTWIRRK